MFPKAWVVVLVLGSLFRGGFFLFVTLGFLPTVNGQPHRGISPPKPALWSRPRLGKKRHCLSSYVSSLTHQSLLQLLQPQLMLVLLSPSILFPLCPSVSQPLVCPSMFAFVWHVCGFQSSFWQQRLQIIKWMLKLELDYLSWLHKSSHNSRLCHCLLTVVMVGEGVLNVWV